MTLKERYQMIKQNISLRRDYVVIKENNNKESNDEMYFFKSNNDQIYVIILAWEFSSFGITLYSFPMNIFQEKERRLLSFQIATRRIEGRKRWTTMWTVRRNRTTKKNSRWSNMWKYLKENNGKLFYHFQDKTIHEENCKDPNLTILPFIKDDWNLVCSYCEASVDIEWFRNITFRNRIIWNDLWTLEDFYIYWIPEEVLQSIMEMI
jgi:hypothetical protein